ncbi:MAG: ribonuclease E/G [Lachnospiraceae bacterium]|nr:ribonuclease E/G [Lachnospiraceae bacterium]
MSKRFVVTSVDSFENRMFAGVFDDHKLTEVNVVSKDPPMLGRIYAVKVRNVSPNLDACFVSAGDDLIFYLPYEELTDAYFIKKSSDRKKICEGDELLVQVSTEAIKTKNARCTCRLSVAGTFCVVTSYPVSVTASKKLSPEEKERLISVAQSVTDKKTGIILRTNAGEADDEAIGREIMQLQQKLGRILEYGTKSTPFTCLYADRPSYVSLLSDICGRVDSVVTDDRAVYDEFTAFAKETDLSILDKLSFYEDEYPLDKLYSMGHQIDKALKNTVFLPSGGNIIITVTEALTVIDVNTGSNVKNTAKENIILNTNIEAAREIAFQLRLRNISGIVITDFIDMDKNGEDEVMSVIAECSREDICRINVVGFTKLGLLELTRQKKRRSLYEQLK